jgi:hypothetical protein
MMPDDRYTSASRASDAGRTYVALSEPPVFRREADGRDVGRGIKLLTPVVKIFGAGGLGAGYQGVEAWKQQLRPLPGRFFGRKQVGAGHELEAESL